MMNFIFGGRTVDSIVASLGSMVEQLENHERENRDKAREHRSHSGWHENEAILATGEADKAAIVKQKILGLISG